MSKSTDVLIVGAGLSGLRLAHKLEQSGTPYHLIEIRDRFGGRIKTCFEDDGYFDMGPAWFWHGQPRIQRLVEDLGLQVFEQYGQGSQSYEDDSGAIRRGAGASMMMGSLRLVGGLVSLIDALVRELPKEKLSLNTSLDRLDFGRYGIEASVSQKGKQRVIAADRVVLCVPPRVIAQKVEFHPALPQPTISAMNDIATWMAGQAKAVAVYDQPFWRMSGLSGDAISRAGPMVEIHDASPYEGGPFALFGFIGVPVTLRHDKQKLQHAVLQQLARLFGSKALKPKSLFVKDWAYDSNTSVPLDHEPAYTHPTYNLPRAMQRLYEGRLLFGSTEVAPQFGGFLEGALEAADNAAKEIEQKTDDSLMNELAMAR